MKNSKKKKPSCLYSECRLQENNNIYLFQACYAIISFIILASNINNFTLITVLLFIAPFLMDLLHSGSPLRWVRGIRLVLIAVDVALVLFSIAGFYALEQYDTYFAVTESAMFLSGVSIQKTHILYLCAVNIFVPVFLYCTVPCKKAAAALEEAQTILESKRQNQSQKEEVAAHD